MQGTPARGEPCEECRSSVGVVTRKAYVIQDLVSCNGTQKQSIQHAPSPPGHALEKDSRGTCKNAVQQNFFFCEQQYNGYRQVDN